MSVEDTIEAIKDLEDNRDLQWAIDNSKLSFADLRELAEAYEALDLKVRKARTVIACGSDSHAIVRTIADVLFESYPCPVELPSAPSGGESGETWSCSKCGKTAALIYPSDGGISAECAECLLSDELSAPSGDAE